MIALAYVLCQPFPTFALIGPRTQEETRTSVQALEITLTPAELQWLNLEDEKNLTEGDHDKRQMMLKSEREWGECACNG